LGPARDFDVLIEGRVRSMHHPGPITAELGVLENDLEVKRDAGVEKAKAALDSERYRELGLRTALWVTNGEWSSSPEPLLAACRERSAAEFAAEHIAKRMKKILKKLENLEALDASVGTNSAFRSRNSAMLLNFSGRCLTAENRPSNANASPKSSKTCRDRSAI
jgi:hypothetical protein